jgi:hypothetical protein
MCKNVGVRLIALFLSVTLTGPAAVSLLCDWACAEKHARTPATAGCHAPSLAAAHTCHDVSAADSSILTSTPQLALVAVVPVRSFTDA